MARPVSWLPLLTTIRRSVSGSVRSHYERGDLELLFQLQPRAAGKLLKLLPTVHVLNGLMVERAELEKFLDRVAAAGDVPALLKQVRAERAAPSRRKIRGLKRYDLDPVPMAALPDYMTISRGRVVVDFTIVDQLAEGMFMLAGVLLHELDAFIAAYEPASLVQQQWLEERADLEALYTDLREREAAKRAQKKPPNGHHEIDLVIPLVS
jgi:hypothetical protein